MATRIELVRTRMVRMMHLIKDVGLLQLLENLLVMMETQRDLVYLTDGVSAELVAQRRKQSRAEWLLLA